METPFGAFLDPVADKLMVACVLVIIVQQQASAYLAIPAAIIIGREITIASLREWMAEIGQRATVKVSQLAKWKLRHKCWPLACYYSVKTCRAFQSIALAMPFYTSRLF